MQVSVITLRSSQSLTFWSKQFHSCCYCLCHVHSHYYRHHYCYVDYHCHYYSHYYRHCYCYVDYRCHHYFHVDCHCHWLWCSHILLAQRGHILEQGYKTKHVYTVRAQNPWLLMFLSAVVWMLLMVNLLCFYLFPRPRIHPMGFVAGVGLVVDCSKKWTHPTFYCQALGDERGSATNGKCSI